jgi:hypothetical protein
LATLGDHTNARQLNEDTLARRRRILGDNHPDTLATANNLALVIAALRDCPDASRPCSRFLVSQKPTLLLP